MTVTENVTVYKCGHCKKKLFIKGAMLRHETNCSYNPANFAKCSGCRHLSEIKIPYTVNGYNGYYETEQDREAKGFFCTKLSKKLYPFKVVKKGLLGKYPETFEDQELMPKECDSYDDSFDF
jgi:hypothetical protein